MFHPSVRQYEIPSNWAYRGEGNCHLVISLPKERKILRIRKQRKTSSLLGWLFNWITDILFWYCGAGVDAELRDLTFYKKIIRPLIGKHFVCDGEQVLLSRKQINPLEEKLAPQRPGHRKMKCLQSGRASLFLDYAYLPDDFYSNSLTSDTFAVEIKPKQGWIPPSEKHFPQCTFCMNQYIKLDKGQITSMSSYCPRDLFSGESNKMVRALKALIQNPQNNFKIFKNGRLSFGENGEPETFQNLICDLFHSTNENFESLVLEFCLLLKNCLLTNFETGVKSNDCNMKLYCECNSMLQESSERTKLPEGCVLERILSVQMLDLDGNQYYYKMLQSTNVREYEYVNELLEEETKKQGTCLKCIIMTLGSRKRNNYLKIVPYLISAIAKDCSLMLTFRELKDFSNVQHGLKNIINTKYGSFVANVGVFDLYPKPASTIIKTRRKQRKMIEMFNNKV